MAAAGVLLGSSRASRPRLARNSPFTLLRPLASTYRRCLSSYLVTPAELNEALKKNPPSTISPDPRVITICAARFLPNDADRRTRIDSFRMLRFLKARFFDLD